MRTQEIQWGGLYMKSTECSIITGKVFNGGSICSVADSLGHISVWWSVDKREMWELHILSGHFIKN